MTTFTFMAIAAGMFACAMTLAVAMDKMVEGK